MLIIAFVSIKSLPVHIEFVEFVMVRPSIKGVKKKKKQYKRMAVEYRHKKELLDYIDEGHTLSEALDKFYGDLTGKARRAKQQLISKWRANAVTINSACKTGHSRHLNLRQRGMATVLSKRAEEDIVLWINTLRKDGAPVSRTMLKLKARDTADDCGPSDEQFTASSSWIGYWTPPVVACAASLNVILLKVPPKYRYVCQPADISWNKPFKGELRSLWIDRFKEQLLSYKQGASERLRKKTELEDEIFCIQKTLDQENASKKIAALRKKIDNEKFTLVAPSRKDMADWITSCWEQLSADTIISGFSKAGLVTDTRVTNPDHEKEVDVDGLVEELERHHIAEEEVTSEDDIGSEVSSSDNDSRYADIDSE
ncbi:unnamed protein product [Phytophthora fragariaefolia]|uniref:Unnamed protein product n=1 Tax=Phytophthora fragariaefolia TaxID=1490495 RepID=A0A9W6TQN0_9STRA|nr:unnamed protein product [Phytophthora fragariaefolia]